MTDETAIHQLLGELKGDMQSSQRQRADLFILVRDIGTQVTTLVAELKAHMDKEDALEIKHDTLDGRVTSLEGYKNKILGAWGIMGMGVISQIDMVKNFFTGGRS